MAADKLALYNMALGHLRERSLASLSENREPRRVLDSFWDQAVAECLEAGMWKFMLRTIQIDSSQSIIPTFGYQYAFAIPTDRVRSILVSTTETFVPPLIDYNEEAGYWYADYTPLFVKYISNDVTYGMDLSKWTAKFTAYVTYTLAVYICGRVTGSETLLAGPDGLLKRQRNAKMSATSMDAMNDPPGQLPTGTWTRSRRGFLRGVPLPGGTQFDD